LREKPDEAMALLMRRGARGNVRRRITDIPSCGSSRIDLGRNDVEASKYFHALKTCPVDPNGKSIESRLHAKSIDPGACHEFNQGLCLRS
jgi:hypothetical protein